jgi:hypothetical protein
MSRSADDGGAVSQHTFDASEAAGLEDATTRFDTPVAPSRRRSDGDVVDRETVGKDNGWGMGQ